MSRFLTRVSILTRDVDSKSVRPSVRYVPVSDENGLTYRHRFFHHTVAESYQFYQHQTSSRNSDGVTPCGGANYRWGIKISKFSTNKSLYLANDTTYRHSYYGRRIRTRMRSIKMVPFLMTLNEPNPVFKVTTNGYRYELQLLQKANRKPHPSF